MCYYNGVKVLKSEFIRLKDIEKAVAAYDFLTQPLQPGFDYGSHAVLKKNGDHDFDIVKMEWGFIPSYIRTREEAFRMRNGFKKADGQFKPPVIMLNAVSEELLQPNKVFRDAALNRRCLILSTGFFEWRHVYPLNKRTGQPLKTALKYPYHIGPKNREYFFMAGIYNTWKDVETGEYAETYAIVTTAANSLMEQVHNTKKRMPTILDENRAYRWLFDDLSEEEITAIAKYQYPSGQLEACTVAKDFREARDPHAVFEYEGLEPLVL